MSLRVVGAGFPRTGTSSLHNALVRLLGGRCYHMDEVFANLDHVPVWRAALGGKAPEWDDFLGGYSAAVDWPASAFWRDLAAANPEAPVVLSVRQDAEAWWRSADRTILQVARRDEYPEYGDWLSLFHELLTSMIGEHWDDPVQAMAAYERHNGEVRDAFSPDRLVVWEPEEGWGPICRALGVDVPTEPFPHINTTEDWERESEEADEEAAVQ
jgi:Sulfotransferase domain